MSHAEQRVEQAENPLGVSLGFCNTQIALQIEAQHVSQPFPKSDPRKRKQAANMSRSKLIKLRHIFNGRLNKTSSEVSCTKSCTL